MKYNAGRIHESDIVNGMDVRYAHASDRARNRKSDPFKVVRHDNIRTLFF